MTQTHIHIVKGNEEIRPLTAYNSVQFCRRKTCRTSLKKKEKEEKLQASRYISAARHHVISRRAPQERPADQLRFCDFRTSINTMTAELQQRLDYLINDLKAYE